MEVQFKEVARQGPGIGYKYMRSRIKISQKGQFDSKRYEFFSNKFT